MHLTKPFFASWRSRLHLFMLKLNTGPLAWGILLLTVALFYLLYFSYARPGMTMDQLTPIGMCSTLPMCLGAWLRARRGALLAWLLALPSIIIRAIFAYGANWAT